MCPSTNASEYLHCCIATYAMRHIQPQVAFYHEKRDIVQKALEKKYGHKLAGKVIYAGSVAKSTAINVDYDVDLIAPFGYDAFSNLEEMSRDIFRFFQNEFWDPHQMPAINQRVSVGLGFTKPGVTISMDVVPGREVKRDGYEPDQYLTLFDAVENRYFQTNVTKQIEAIRASNPDARTVIRLLKVWKFHYGKKMVRGFVLELLVICAFKDAGDKVPEGLWPQLEMVVTYIRDHIGVVCLVDTGNSNNVVSEGISAAQKSELANAMRNMLDGIQGRPAKLCHYFPINSSFSIDQ